MKDNSFDGKLEIALDQLRGRENSGDFDRFECEVWAAIALRDDSITARMLRRPGADLPYFSAAGVVACMAMAVAIGMAAAFSLAELYAKQASQVWERRYVASIHPVLRSVEAGSEFTHP